MTKILNLTQHAATGDQMDAGVYEPTNKARVRELLTFEDAPTALEIRARAGALADIAAAQGAEAAMIGGAPFLMAPLHQALIVRGIRPVYAFSRREVVETRDPEGNPVKQVTFRHLGFVPAP